MNKYNTISTPNYCKNCKFLNSFGLCKEAADIGINIITGFPFKSAQDPEKMRYSEAYCGHEGKWFEHICE